MKNNQLLNILFFLIVFALFTMCSKNKNDKLIQGQIINRETNEPIQGFVMTFDVASGSGFFGSVEKAKYSAITNENGKFSFTIDKKDIGNWFWVNEHSAGNYCWSNIDTLDIQNKYILVDNDRYISTDNKTTLVYSPRGIINFFVKMETFNELNLDTIIVNSQYDSDTIIRTNASYESFRNKKLYVEPSKIHSFTYLAIKNGEISKEIAKNIYVRHDCSHELGTPGEFYEVKFN